MWKASKREKKCGKWQENKKCNPLAATCRELCGAAFQEGLSEKLHPESSVTASLLILCCIVLPYVGTSVQLKCNMFPKNPTWAWFSPCFSYVGCHLHSPDHHTTVQGTAVSQPSCWPPSRAHHSLSVLSRSLNFGALLTSL